MSAGPTLTRAPLPLRDSALPGPADVAPIGGTWYPPRMANSQQAHTALRAHANDAAWWIRHAASVIRSEGLAPGLASSLDKQADNLAQAVKDANDALDREAFGA